MNTGAARALVADSQDHPSPEDFLAEANAIFNLGTLRGAREVAERGLALYPDHPELRRLHHALRPFEVRVSSEPNSFDPRASYDWLKKSSAQYRGKWVGLDMGELVAASENYQEVVEALKDHDHRGTLIHFID
jgi:hypothetical protein